MTTGNARPRAPCRRSRPDDCASLPSPPPTPPTFAIRDRESDRLVGCIGLTICTEHARGELGYWIGPLDWGQGFCAEAAATVLRFGFDTLALRRIQARHLVRNPASGAVMRRIGMRHEGTFRDYVVKDGVFEDLAQYAILSNATDLD